MHTVDSALERDRVVLAVPGPVRSPASSGTNALLAAGCAPCRDAGDVLVALGLTPVAQAQAAATQQSSAAVEQIERAAGSTREAAAAAVALLAALAPRLAGGRASLAALQEAMAAGVAETRAVAGMAGALEGSGRRIERIVDRIALVAVQINMLAVSGSVEAARAGDAGRGFSVVSADIRALAARAREMT